MTVTIQLTSVGLTQAHPKHIDSTAKELSIPK